MGWSFVLGQKKVSSALSKDLSQPVAGVRSIRGKMDIKKKVLEEVYGIYGIIGQTIGRLHPSLTLTQELKKIEELIKSIAEGIEHGDFDKEVQ